MRACAAIIGPTKSSASEIARASSGVGLGKRVAVEFLVHADDIALELGVDRALCAAEVHQREQGEVFLRLVFRDVELLDQARRGIGLAGVAAAGE